MQSRKITTFKKAKNRSKTAAYRPLTSLLTLRLPAAYSDRLRCLVRKAVGRSSTGSATYEPLHAKMPVLALRKPYGKQRLIARLEGTGHG